MSRREQVLAALMAVLETHLAANVPRNEVLPENVPASGLVILRDGEPDVTLNLRAEFYSRRVEIEAYVARDATHGRGRGGARCAARRDWHHGARPRAELHVKSRRVVLVRVVAA